MDFNKLFNEFTNIKIAVIGDVMLDTYWWGNVERISPEAPVPIVSVAKKEQRIGGAGNVALNVAALGGEVSILSVIGEDDNGAELKKLFENNNINEQYIIKSNERITTNKTRIISKNQHMMRLDEEVLKPLSAIEEENLISTFKDFIQTQKPHLVILEDYNKGVLTKKVITTIIGLCKENNIYTAVDPKQKNFFAYKGVDIFKPNLKELKDAFNILEIESTVNSLTDLHNKLKIQLQHQISCITLSEKGIFYATENEQEIIPTHIRSIADVSGAGDTVIAVASLVYAATKDIKLMASLANIAGGLVCEEVGTVAINKNIFQTECENIFR
jgi:D-glycero-beta-D-manno-heptose-7-phosphate kinase